MRKPKTQKKTQPQSTADDTIDALLAVAVGAALVSIFGGLVVVWGWKALIVGAPL